MPDRLVGPRSHVLGCYMGHARGEGELAGFRPNRPKKIEIFFQFSKKIRIYKLNIIQIQILNDFNSQNKIQ
jgi:hypothetical protein